MYRYMSLSASLYVFHCLSLSVSHFQGKKKEKMHIRQRAFKVLVGDPFAQYWCIDFDLVPKSSEGIGLPRERG